MWGRRPPRELVQGWIDRALELAEPGSTTEAKALVATAMWDWRQGVEPARRAVELAERLGDPELRASAYMARSLASFAAIDYDDSIEWAQRTLELDGQISDPDLQVEVYFTGVFPAAGRGDFAKRAGSRASTTSATQRCLRITVCTASRCCSRSRSSPATGTGPWSSRREPRRASRRTSRRPAFRNARALYVCALARSHRGEEERARVLAEQADEVALEGYGLTIDALRIRLAVARNDLGEVERLIGGEHTFPQVFNLGSQAGLLDGLAALRDRERTEVEAGRLLTPGTYLEPFALRALGLVREDERLVAQAVERFEAMGLDWYADQTRRLVAEA